MPAPRFMMMMFAWIKMSAKPRAHWLGVLQPVAVDEHESEEGEPPDEHIKGKTRIFHFKQRTTHEFS